MNQFNRNVGEWIAMLRIKRRMTREQLAEIANITERFVYDIESGKKGCSNETLMRLSKALCVSADFLLTGEDPLSHHPFPSELLGIIQMLSALPADDLLFMETIIRDCIGFANRKSYLFFDK